MQTFKPSKTDIPPILEALQATVAFDVEGDVKPVWQKYLSYSADSSNKFHYFAVLQSKINFIAANAYGRIGYTPQVSVIGEFKTKEEAIAAAEAKMETKVKKGYDFVNASKVAGEFFSDGSFIIVSKTEKDDITGEPLYWNNDDGWTVKEGATQFTEDEAKTLNLPMLGEWIKVSSKVVDVS
jgi:predicted DNA-binding WGR domain protein